MAVSAQSRFERFYLVVIDMLLLLLNWYPYVVLLLKIYVFCGFMLFSTQMIIYVPESG